MNDLNKIFELHLIKTIKELEELLKGQILLLQMIQNKKLLL